MQDKLYRIRQNRMLAGVCTGLGEYFDIDPVIIRLVFVITTFLSGVGLIGYILLWIIVPEKNGVINASSSSGNVEVENPVFNNEGDPENEINKSNSKKDRSLIFGAGLIILGVIFLTDNFFPYFLSHDLWPLILVGLGIFLIIKSKNKGNV